MITYYLNNNCRKMQHVNLEVYSKMKTEAETEADTEADPSTDNSIIYVCVEKKDGKTISEY